MYTVKEELLYFYFPHLLYVLNAITTFLMVAAENNKEVFQIVVLIVFIISLGILSYLIKTVNLN